MTTALYRPTSLPTRNQRLALPQMVDTKQQQQRRQRSLREVVFLKKKVGTDPRHSDLIQELNVLEAATAEEFILDLQFPLSLIKMLADRLFDLVKF